MYPRNLPNYYFSGSGSGAQGAQGPPGPAGSSVVAESFSICRSSDNNVGPGSFAVTGNWVDILPGTFTNFETASIYQNLTYGSLSLPAGTFTCGYTGTYRISLTFYNDVNLSASIWIINTVSARDFCYLNIDGECHPVCFEQLVNLNVGDQLLLNGQNASGGFLNIPYQSTDPASSRLVPSLIWTLELIDAAGPQGSTGPQGPQGPAAVTTPNESFNLALGANLNYPGVAGFVPMAPLIDAVNPVDCPAIYQNGLYQNLISGSLNLATGEFTVGVTGEYLMSYVANPSGNDFHILVNGVPVNKNLETASSTVQESVILPLFSGDVVTFEFYDPGLGAGALPYLYTDGGTGFIQYGYTWQCALISSVQGPQGPQGPAGSGGSPEAFAIALGQNFASSAADTYDTLSDWSDAVDVPSFPDVAPETLFQNLTTGTLNLVAGTFTVGSSGVYLLTIPQNADGNNGVFYFYPIVNGVGRAAMWQADRAIYTSMLNLTVGDVVTIEAITPTNPNVIIYQQTTQTTAPLIAYTIIWTMAKIA